MRIGLYGLPTAGKSFVLKEINNLEVLSGSSLLKEIAPDFEVMSDLEKKNIRIKLAEMLAQKDNFIMDGHYSFGDKIVFTEEDGRLYDAFVYLYVNPEVLRERMEDSVKNKKYLIYDIEKWQNEEIRQLRDYCHNNNKDFYVLDNPEKGAFYNIGVVIEFINSIICGFSCVKKAQKITENILAHSTSDIITLTDGDKTFIKEDSCGLIGYKTHLFDGNFYSGFQSWRHHKELIDFLRGLDYSMKNINDYDIHINDKVIDKFVGDVYILSSGYLGIWKQISKKYDIQLFCGDDVSADTKYYVTKFLKDAGKTIYAFGDSMNDYYMLKKADKSYLCLKDNNRISSSLLGMDLEGIVFEANNN